MITATWLLGTALNWLERPQQQTIRINSHARQTRREKFFCALVRRPRALEFLPGLITGAGVGCATVNQRGQADRNCLKLRGPGLVVVGSERIHIVTLKYTFLRPPSPNPLGRNLGLLGEYPTGTPRVQPEELPRGL